MAETRLLIPKDRIGVVIGKGGEVKHQIEEKLGVKVEIDSREGEILIRGSDQNPLSVLRAKEIFLAMGRGFSPERAFRLLDESQYLQVLNLTDYVSENALQRIRGRLIGQRGKTRRAIEESLNVYVSIYGKTVSIIGDPQAVKMATQAVEMLVRGAQHSTVYKFLDKARKELKEMSKLQALGKSPVDFPQQS